MTLRLKILIISFIFQINFGLAQVAFNRIDSLNNYARQITNFDSSRVMLEEVIKMSKAAKYDKGLTSAMLGKAMNLHNHGSLKKQFVLLLKQNLSF